MNDRVYRDYLDSLPDDIQAQIESDYYENAICMRQGKHLMSFRFNQSLPITKKVVGNRGLNRI